MHLASVQTFIIKKVAGNLSKELQTKITIDHVDFFFYDQLEFKNLTIYDRSGDTLLYAGSSTTKINDWFFLKPTIELKYIGLENGYVNLRRKTPEWNYQFLLDYFSADENKKTSTKNEVNIQLRELDLKNIIFRELDQWKGEDLIFSVRNLHANIGQANLNKRDIHIKELRLINPIVLQKDYTGTRPADYVASIKKTSKTNTKNDWNLIIDKTFMQGGSYINERETERAPYEDQFDGMHFTFYDLVVNASNTRISNHSIQSSLDLSVKEKKGLHVKKLTADFYTDSSVMKFSKLNADVNNSHLEHSFSMHYDDFISDMKHFEDHVIMEGDFMNSTLVSDDVSIFIPFFKKWNRKIQIKGKITGSLNDLETDSIQINSGGSYYQGNLHIKNLTDIDNLYLYADVKDSKITYNDLKQLAPPISNLQGINIKSLGDIGYKGTFDGFLNEFISKGSLHTNIGNIQTDLKLSIPNTGQPTYSGIVSTNAFDIGTLVSSPVIHQISMSGKINGVGFSASDFKAKFNGDIHSITLKDYTYHQIKYDGTFNAKGFSGQASINDPNLEANNITGHIDWSGINNIYELDADLKHINLGKLGFLSKEIKLSGHTKLQFNGTHIDNFQGSANLYDLKIDESNHHVVFDSITLQSKETNTGKILILSSNEFAAQILGNFKVMEIPDAFSFFLSRYYPAYFGKPSYHLNNQSFSFGIVTKNISKLLPFMNEKWQGGNDATITGYLDISEDKKNILNESPDFSIAAQIPTLNVSGKNFNDIDLESYSYGDTLESTIQFSDIQINNKIHFPNTKINLRSSNDISDIQIKTVGNNTLNNTDLNARVTNYIDGFKLQFFPSNFVLNDKKWMLEKDGELTLRKDYLDFNEINFSNREQRISVSSEKDPNTHEIRLIAKLKNLALEDFAGFLLKNQSIAGKLNGQATVFSPFKDPSIGFKGDIDSLVLNNRTIGDLDISSAVNTSSGLAQFNIESRDSLNQFSLKGGYNYKDSSDKSLAVNIEAKTLELALLEPYLKEIFSDMSGRVTGKLALTGNSNEQFLTGDMKIMNAGLKVGYTQCKYYLNDQTVTLKKNQINLNLLQLKDSLGYTASLSGKINHHFFNDFYFENIKLESSKISLLNTKRKDNTSFWGNIIGNANMTMNGPLSNIKMYISGSPSLLDSSHIYLNTDDTKESRSVDYIVFKKEGETEIAGKQKNNNNFTVNLKIIANPTCKVDVILDEETKDTIHGFGTGELNISAGLNEALSISGQYNLIKGYYTFNFQTFFKKPFTLKNGKIIWDKNPGNALIDLQAEYEATDVDVSSLSSLGGFNQKENIKIISTLKGYLNNPEIKFDFVLSEKVGDAKRDDVLLKRLAEFKNDENEMNKQVASLLLFNTFIIGDQNFLSQGNATRLITKSIGGMVSNILTSFLNRELEKATKGLVSTYIDINPTWDLQKNVSQIQADVKAGLKILLSKRLEVLVGGKLDYNNPAYTQLLEKKGLITPDITVEWLINKDGSLRVVGFNRSSVDYTLDRRNRSGIQLSYRKEIDHLSDIFKSRKKIETLEEKKTN